MPENSKPFGALLPDLLKAIGQLKTQPDRQMNSEIQFERDAYAGKKAGLPNKQVDELFRKLLDAQAANKKGASPGPKTQPDRQMDPAVATANQLGDVVGKIEKGNPNPPMGFMLADTSLLDMPKGFANNKVFQGHPDVQALISHLSAIIDQRKANTGYNAKTDSAKDLRPDQQKLLDAYQNLIDNIPKEDPYLPVPKKPANGGY